ncbi:phage major capsid protein, partial [Streptomyces sp. NPDC056159]|uniref:phage major capsid protein n=1 Tax=Streptomyces sp. NPDC056159 TaxID=3155537 RepID=UPI0034488F4F
MLICPSGSPVCGAVRAYVSWRRCTGRWARTLKDKQDQYLWQPSIQVGVPDTLLGKPV